MSNRLISIRPNQYVFDFTQSSNVWGLSSLAGSMNPDIMLFGEGFINDEIIAKCLSHILDPILADLVDVALFVYLADRLSLRRKQTNPQHHFQWSRKKQLKIPVRLPEVWSDSTIHGSLRQLLRFFTEDEWQIDFVLRHKEMRASESQTPLFQSTFPDPFRVALYSGGLDSFAGAIQQIAELPDHHLILVSGVTNPRQGNGQKEQIKAIKSLAPERVTHVPVSYGLRSGTKQSEESSQRSRGFLFMILGAVTALVAGSKKLHIYENGIGAINLPYDGTQIGTSNTRSVNPISLLRMSRFISDLTNMDFHIYNPFLFHTKAEMCGHRDVKRLEKYINTTFSCDGFPIRKKGQPQCGLCTSCLLRRQSLESAGLSKFDVSSEYLRDWQSFPVDRVKLRPLLAMEWQFHVIEACLAAKNPWQTLIKKFPSLMEVVSEIFLATGSEPEQLKTGILRLYSQYVSEWKEFSARGLLSSQALAA